MKRLTILAAASALLAACSLQPMYQRPGLPVSAGYPVGAAYRGSLAGMKSGTIIVDGSAGLEVGMRMRRGTIVIGGPAKDFTGLQMKGGTIILLSGAEIRTGAEVAEIAGVVRRAGKHELAGHILRRPLICASRSIDAARDLGL